MLEWVSHQYGNFLDAAQHGHFVIIKEIEQATTIARGKPTSKIAFLIYFNVFY